MWSKYVYNNVWRDLRLLVPVFPTVARKSFNEETKIYEIYKILSFLAKKLLTILRKCYRQFKGRFCDINNCLMLKYLLKDYQFYCFKNYGSPKPVIRLKITPNMEDRISLFENLP